MKLTSIIFCTLLTVAGSRGASTNDLPRFEELFQSIRTNLNGVSETELDQAAVRGLLGQLKSQVILESSVSNAVPQAAEIVKVEIYDGSYQYLRLKSVTGDIAEKMAAALKQNPATTNKIKGLVLDLRFASGTDYEAAGAVADQFIKTEQPLIDWGTGSTRSTLKENAISLPLAILVNSKTTGAAEALAAVLREARVGLIIGSTTSGQASVFKEVTLSGGQKLKIATAPVKIGEKVLLNSVVPDIKIQTNLELEAAYLVDPYKVSRTSLAQGSATNVADGALTNHSHRRFNEAELVRQQREGADPEEETSASSLREEPGRPVITDPALARAIDLLKALAVVQKGTSSFIR